jgi:hypothetical protein
MQNKLTIRQEAGVGSKPRLSPDSFEEFLPIDTA